MSQPDDDSEKSHEPTPKKLEDARKKGEVPRSADLSTAAAYGGLLLAAMALGPALIPEFGTALMVLIDQPDRLAPLFFEHRASAAAAGLIGATAVPILPLFAVPFLAVLAAIIAQRAFVVAPSKLQPKLSRISILSNAKNKFGRNGWFEFAKSFVKLVIYSLILALFLRSRLPQMMATMHAGPALAGTSMMRMCLDFLSLVLVIAAAIGGLDFFWQRAEHLRKHRMTRKEIMDETKQSEGDPHMKSERRAKGQQIAMSQVMAEVPNADVVIVNPTHYAVALKWSRLPGTAPECVAKGVDEIALKMREIAKENGVPIHSDPPCARALHATVDVGQEILPEHYQAVAAAIRFAEKMRKRAKFGR